MVVIADCYLIDCRMRFKSEVMQSLDQFIIVETFIVADCNALAGQIDPRRADTGELNQSAFDFCDAAGTTHSWNRETCFERLATTTSRNN